MRNSGDCSDARLSVQPCHLRRAQIIQGRKRKRGHCCRAMSLQTGQRRANTACLARLFSQVSTESAREAARRNEAGLLARSPGASACVQSHSTLMKHCRLQSMCSPICVEHGLGKRGAPVSPMLVRKTVRSGSRNMDVRMAARTRYVWIGASVAEYASFAASLSKHRSAPRSTY